MAKQIGQSAEKAAFLDSNIDPLAQPVGSSALPPGRAESKRPAPTAEQIVAMASADEQYWEARNTRMKDDQDLHDDTETISNEVTGEMALKLNDPKVIVEKVAGLIGRKDYRIEVPAKGPENTERAQKIENALRWWKNYSNRSWQQAIHNPLSYDQAKSLILRGWVCARITLDPESEYLIDEILVDPYTIFPRITRKKVTHVCHIYTATIEELLEDFPEAEATFADQDRTKSVKVIAYYENEPPYWYGVIVGNEFVKEPVALGYWPWVIVVAKGSFSHQSINDTQENHSATIGTGILDAVKGLVDVMNKFVTILANTAAKQENPPSITWTISGQEKEIDLSPGARNTLTVGENFKQIEVGPGMGQLMPLLSTLQDRLNKGSLPSAMFGEGTSLESGFMSALMMGAAQDTLWTFIKALESFHAMRFEQYLKIFRDFAAKPIQVLTKASAQPGVSGLPQGSPNLTMDTRRVWGESLDPMDIQINGTYVEVFYEDISPQDRVALAQLAAVLVDKKLVDLRTAREKYLGFDDPDLINLRVLGDLIYMSPDAVKQLSMIALSILQRQPELLAALGAEAAAQNTANPGAVNPLPTEGEGRTPERFRNLPPGVLPPEAAGLPTESVPNDEQLIAQILGQGGMSNG